MFYIETYTYKKHHFNFFIFYYPTQLFSHFSFRLTKNYGNIVLTLFIVKKQSENKRIYVRN